MYTTFLRQIMGATVIEQHADQTIIGIAIHGRAYEDGLIEVMWNHSTSPILMRFEKATWEAVLLRHVLIFTQRQTDLSIPHASSAQRHQVFIVLQPR